MCGKGRITTENRFFQFLIVFNWQVLKMVQSRSLSLPWLSWLPRKIIISTFSVFGSDSPLGLCRKSKKFLLIQLHWTHFCNQKKNDKFAWALVQLCCHGKCSSSSKLNECNTIAACNRMRVGFERGLGTCAGH